MYLSNNNLRSVPPEIGNCVNLVTLWLNNNELTSVPAELGNLLALEMLDVSENDLTTLPAEIGGPGASRTAGHLRQLGEDAAARVAAGGWEARGVGV